MFYIKGKINHFDRECLKQIAPDLDVDNFDGNQFDRWYDALEEVLLNEGFVLDEEPIALVKVLNNGSKVYHKYNCAVVITVGGAIKSIGIKYISINNNKMTDFEKLVYARNHLKAHTINGKPEEDGVKSFDYLDEIIKKMKNMGLRSLKSLK